MRKVSETDAWDDGDDGVSSVMEEIHGLVSDGGPDEAPPLRDEPGPRVRNLNSGEEAYAAWVADKTPENMSRVVEAMYPTINSEIMRYSGPKTLLRSKAKALVAKAVRTFNPMSGARLQSWVVTNLKPLSRYSVRQRDVRTPEVAARQAAEVWRATESLRDELGRDPTDEELADEIGISPKRVAKVRSMSVASVNSGVFDEAGAEDQSSAPGVVTPERVPFAVEAVYQGLSPEDRILFDSVTGSHGARQLPARDVASMLRVSPAQVSGRAADIARQISWIVNNG